MATNNAINYSPVSWFAYISADEINKTGDGSGFSPSFSLTKFIGGGASLVGRVIIVPKTGYYHVQAQITLSGITLQPFGWLKILNVTTGELVYPSLQSHAATKDSATILTMYGESIFYAQKGVYLSVNGVSMAYTKTVSCLAGTPENPLTFFSGHLLF